MYINLKKKVFTCYLLSLDNKKCIIYRLPAHYFISIIYFDALKRDREKWKDLLFE